MTSHLKSPLVIALILCLSAPLVRCDGHPPSVTGEAEPVPADGLDGAAP